MHSWKRLLQSTWEVLHYSYVPCGLKAGMGSSDRWLWMGTLQDVLHYPYISWRLRDVMDSQLQIGLSELSQTWIFSSFLYLKIFHGTYCTKQHSGQNIQCVSHDVCIPPEHLYSLHFQFSSISTLVTSVILVWSITVIWQCICRLGYDFIAEYTGIYGVQQKIQVKSHAVRNLHRRQQLDFSSVFILIQK